MVIFIQCSTRLLVGMFNNRNVINNNNESNNQTDHIFK